MNIKITRESNPTWVEFNSLQIGEWYEDKDQDLWYILDMFEGGYETIFVTKNSMYVFPLGSARCEKLKHVEVEVEFKVKG